MHSHRHKTVGSYFLNNTSEKSYSKIRKTNISSTIYFKNIYYIKIKKNKVTEFVLSTLGLYTYSDNDDFDNVLYCIQCQIAQIMLKIILRMSMVIQTLSQMAKIKIESFYHFFFLI